MSWGRGNLQLPEEGQHLAIEGGYIGGLPACDPVAVDHNLFIHPVTPGIADIILDRMVARQLPASH